MKLSYRKKGRSVEQRFLDFAYPEPNSGCWIWVGHCTTSGYGRFNIGSGHFVQAHRFSWEMANKAQIPADLLACHKCDVRCCVNPDHIFIGTYSDNANDMHAKGRNNTPRGERHARARLTEMDVKAIRADQRPLDEIGRQYGFDKQYVWKIKRGWHWRHV